MNSKQQKYIYEELCEALANEAKPMKENLAQRLRLCARAGVLRHAIPKEHGGYGDTFVNLCEIHEELGGIILDNSLLLSLNAHIWGAIFPIINFGSIEQQSEYLEILLNGSYIGAQAMTEPDVGSDVASMKTMVEKVDGGYIINGHKKYITNAPIADLIVVYARDGDGFSAYLVSPMDKGVRAFNLNMDGFFSSAIGEVILKDCFIPESRILGKTGSGMSILQKTLELERAFIFSGIVGVMKKHFEIIVSRTHRRKSHDKPLIKNQAISHKIAEMSLMLETIRLWVYKCAKMKDENQRIGLASSYVKLCASEFCLKYYLDIVQAFGALGLDEPYKLSQLVLDALAGRLMSGSSEIQKNIISSLIGSGKRFLPI